MTYKDLNNVENDNLEDRSISQGFSQTPDSENYDEFSFSHDFEYKTHEM